MKQFELLTTKDVGNDVGHIRRAFDLKHELEKKIAKMIKDYEDKTGFAIDMIHYQRDITLPIKGPKYTSMNIIITEEE